jgi:hypothetical protein
MCVASSHGHCPASFCPCPLNRTEYYSTFGSWIAAGTSGSARANEAREVHDPFIVAERKIRARIHQLEDSTAECDSAEWHPISAVAFRCEVLETLDSDVTGPPDVGRDAILERFHRRGFAFRDTASQGVGTAMYRQLNNGHI